MMVSEGLFFSSPSFLCSPSLDVCLTPSCRSICQLKKSFSYDAKLNSWGSTLPRHVLSAWCDLMPGINGGIIEKCRKTRQEPRCWLGERQWKKVRIKWMDDGANLNLVVKRLFSLFFFPFPLSLPHLRFPHCIPSGTSFCPQPPIGSVQHSIFLLFCKWWQSKGVWWLHKVLQNHCNHKPCFSFPAVWKSLFCIYRRAKICYWNPSVFCYFYLLYVKYNPDSCFFLTIVILI